MKKTFRQYDEKTLKALQGVQLEILKEFIRVCEKHNLVYIMIGGTGIGVARHQGFIPWDDDIDVAMPRKDYETFLRIYKKEMGEEYKVLTPLVDSRYACNVTHLQKKGTRFVPYTSKDLKCDLCIDIDIFTLDNMPDDPRVKRRQIRRTWILNKLIFLCGCKSPIIPWKGIKKRVAAGICYLTHYGLKLFRVSPAFLYRCLRRECIRYNGEETRCVIGYEGPMSAKAYLSKEELYPLRDMPFENLMVKMPNQYDVYLRRIYGDYMKWPKEEDRVNHAPYILDFGDGINVFEEKGEKDK